MALRTPIGAGGDDEVRFEDLWADHDVLLTWCRRVAGDSSLADDMVQEAYLEAFRRLDTLERHESFLPWLATVAKRRGLNELRRFRYCTPTDTLPEHALAPDSDPADVAVQRDDVERLKAALTSLTVRERDLLLRQVNTGASIWELAEFDQSTPASVRSVLGRARAKLRAVVREGEARALAPLAGVAGWFRQRMTNLSARMQQLGPQAVVGSDRLGEAVTAMAVAVATIAAPAVAGDGPKDGRGAGVDEVALSGLAVSDVHPALQVRGFELTVAPAEVSRPRPSIAYPGNETTAEPTAEDSVGPTSDSVGDTVEQTGWTYQHVPEPRGPVSTPTATQPLAPMQPAATSEPEEAYFVDLAASGSLGSADSGSGEVFALGRKKGNACTANCTVLFHSVDAGASWTALSAEGIGDAESLMLAPDYPGDRRMYAMGVNNGLLLSTDGGQTFAAAPRAPAGRGPVAMSPAFSGGDERILVGSAPPVVYDAAAPRTRPFAGVPPAGTRSFFAFAPHDARKVFAGSHVHGRDGVKTPGVYRCVDEICAEAAGLEWAPTIPRVYVPTWHGSVPTVVAYAGTRFFVSNDGAHSFQAMSESPGGHMIHAVVDDGNGTLIVATAGGNGEASPGALFSVAQRGDVLEWTRLGGATPLDRGVASLTVLADGSILAAPALDEGGLWCSTDSGRTWDRRCKSS